VSFHFAPGKRPTSELTAAIINNVENKKQVKEGASASTKSPRRVEGFLNFEGVVIAQYFSYLPVLTN
jgi:hypothetical protein